MYPFIIICFLSAIRYDTTTDYHNYVRKFWEYSEGYYTDKALVEVGYTYFNKLFSFTDWGFIFVFAVVSIFIYYSFFIIFKKYSISCIGTFVFLCLGCITNFDNIVRQTVAIAFFNYALIYYFQKRYSYSLICSILAPLFHTSAYAVLAFWPLITILRKKRIPAITGMMVIVSLLIMYFAGIFDIIRDKFLASALILDGFYEHYEEYEFSKRSIGVAFLIRTILCVAPITIIKKVKEEFILLCINMSWFSMVLRIIFAEVPFFYRICDYLTIFNVVAIAYAFKFFGDIKRKKVLNYVLLFLSYLLLFSHVSSYYGFTSVYRTILSENCRDNKFYVRKSFLDVQEDGLENDREQFYILKK